MIMKMRIAISNMIEGRDASCQTDGNPFNRQK